MIQVNLTPSTIFLTNRVSDVNKPFTSMSLPLIMENPINNASAMSGDVKNGFTRRSVDDLNLSHTPITIHVDVDLALLFVAHITGGVAGTNTNAARPAGDPWLDGRDIPDHWDAESAA
jgi:hypothetical protein